jgi:dihydrofolate reductase
MMHGKTITLIAAMGRNRAIGQEGGLPWHLPRELKHFRETTMGKAIVMGRVTWHSIGRALPGRQNIVVSRDPGFTAPGCDVARSLDEAVALARGDEVMIIGGGQLYAAALPVADRMVLTRVDCAPPADTWFPDWDAADWLETAVREEAADANNAYAYRVVELRRRAPGGG